MVENDDLIIGSPTCFTNVTSEIKAVIDQPGAVGCANCNMFKRKAGSAVVLASRERALNVNNAITELFLIEEMVVPRSGNWMFLPLSELSGQLSGSLSQLVLISYLPYQAAEPKNMSRDPVAIRQSDGYPPSLAWHNIRPNPKILLHPAHKLDTKHTKGECNLLDFIYLGISLESLAACFPFYGKLAPCLSIK